MRTRGSSVYLIYEYPPRNDASGAVKVGVARHPEARLRELQTGNARRLQVAWSSEIDRCGIDPFLFELEFVTGPASGGRVV
jgi:hypothetical protein